MFRIQSCTLLSWERRAARLKEDVCIYICDFMIMFKAVYGARLLSAPPMTGRRDVNQEVKMGGEGCIPATDTEAYSAGAQTSQK